MSAIDIIEAALLERYNVRSLDGLGSLLPEAVQQARDGEWAALEAALRGRELYRWRDTVDAALASREAVIDDVPEPEVEAHPEVVEPEPAPDEETQKAGITSSSKPRKGRGE